MPADDSELVKAGIEGVTAATLKPFGDLIQALFGAAASEAGLMLGEQVKYYRLKRQIRLFERTSRLLKNAQIEPHAVALKLLTPIIENASIEDEDDLQDTWANLLANAANSREANAVSASFPTILKELSARDVKFLDGLFVEACARCARGPRSRGVESIKFSDRDLLSTFSSAGLARYPSQGMLSVSESERPDAQADSRDIDFSIDLFGRHGVVVKVFEVPVVKGSTSTYTLGIDYSFTHLGACFVRACREPKPALTSVTEALR